MDEHNTVDKYTLGEAHQAEAHVADDHIDCNPPAEPFAIPESWQYLLELHFAGKVYGASEFGPQFRADTLQQVAAANVALANYIDAENASGNEPQLEPMAEIIDACEVPGSGEKTRPYAQLMILTTAREDVARAYLKALQSKGQMLGTSYTSLANELKEAEAALEAIANIDGGESFDNLENTSASTMPVESVNIHITV